MEPGPPGLQNIQEKLRKRIKRKRKKEIQADLKDIEEEMKSARGRTMTMDGEVSRLLSIEGNSDSINIIRGGESKKDAGK